MFSSGDAISWNDLWHSLKALFEEFGYLQSEKEIEMAFSRIFKNSSQSGPWINGLPFSVIFWFKTRKIHWLRTPGNVVLIATVGLKHC